MCAITFVVCLVGFVASVVILLLQVRDLKYEASQPNQLNTFVIAILPKAWSIGAEKASAPQPEPAHFFWTRCAAPATQPLVLTFPRGARRTPTHHTPTRRTSTCHSFRDAMLSVSVCAPRCTQQAVITASLRPPPRRCPSPQCFRHKPHFTAIEFVVALVTFAIWAALAVLLQGERVGVHQAQPARKQCTPEAVRGQAACAWNSFICFTSFWGLGSVRPTAAVQLHTCTLYPPWVSVAVFYGEIASAFNTSSYYGSGSYGSGYSSSYGSDYYGSGYSSYSSR